MLCLLGTLLFVSECELITPYYFNSQGGEDFIIFKRYFSEPLKCGGTFVEMGALNGLLLSVSLFFERHLDWTGLLIEANPVNYEQVLKNRPNTTTFGVAAGDCPGGAINFTRTNHVTGGGNIINEKANPLLKADGKPVIQVPCVPLGVLIRRAEIQSIDYFILDVEGAEYSSLKTMDWSIPVKVWLVEMNHSKREEEQILGLFSEHGYYRPEIDFYRECMEMLPHIQTNQAFVAPKLTCVTSYIFVRRT